MKVIMNIVKIKRKRNINTELLLIQEFLPSNTLDHFVGSKEINR